MSIQRNPPPPEEPSPLDLGDLAALQPGEYVKIAGKYFQVAGFRMQAELFMGPRVDSGNFQVGDEIEVTLRYAFWKKD